MKNDSTRNLTASKFEQDHGYVAKIFKEEGPFWRQRSKERNRVKSHTLSTVVAVTKNSTLDAELNVLSNEVVGLRPLNVLLPSK